MTSPCTCTVVAVEPFPVLCHFFTFLQASDYPTCPFAQGYIATSWFGLCLTAMWMWNTVGVYVKFFLFLHEGWKNVFLKMPSSVWTRHNPLLAANCSVVFLTKLRGTRTWRWVTRLFILTTFPSIIFHNNTIFHSGRSPCYFAPALLAHGRSSCTWPLTSAAHPKGLPTMQCFLPTNCGLNLIQAWFLCPLLQAIIMCLLLCYIRSHNSSMSCLYNV